MFSTRHLRLLSVLLLLAAISFGAIGSSAAPKPSGVSRSAVTTNHHDDDDEDNGPSRTLIRQAALVLTMDPSLGAGPLVLQRDFVTNRPDVPERVDDGRDTPHGSASGYTGYAPKPHRVSAASGVTPRPARAASARRSAPTPLFYA